MARKDRQQKRFGQLDLALEAIHDALIMALDERDPERREELLGVVERAFAAYHVAHRAAVADRPHLRLLQGGAIAGALAHLVTWARESWGTRAVAVGTVGAVAVAAVAAGLLLRGEDGGSGRPPAAAPLVSAPPNVPPGGPDRDPTAGPTRPEPGTSTPEGVQEGPEEPRVSRTAMGDDATSPDPSGTGSSEQPSPSGSVPGGRVETEPPLPPVPDPDPDPTDDEPQEPGPDPEEPGPDPEAPDRRCIIDLDLPVLVIRVGHLVCL